MHAAGMAQSLGAPIYYDLAEECARINLHLIHQRNQPSVKLVRPAASLGRAPNLKGFQWH